jgi:hypothetical protein
MSRTADSSRRLRPAGALSRALRAGALALLLSALVPLGGVLVAAVEAGSFGAARAETSLGLEVRVGGAAPVVVQDPAVNLAPVPHQGLRVELWSDPDAGAVVRPGTRARLYMRPNADCYLTLLSVDTEGRVSILFPTYDDDGWIPAHQTCVVPSRRAGYDLVFADPPGLEYVYAVASLDPMRYPRWSYSDYQEAADDPDSGDAYQTGWVVGDPFYRMQAFCNDLVPYPDRYDTYDMAWVYFNVGHRVEYPRYLCSDCHAGAIIDPYGPVCPAVGIRCAPVAYAGWFDFSVVFVPRYRYEVHQAWRPRGWQGRRWNGPDGRWVWSSVDGRDRLRRSFVDAPRERPASAGPWRRGPDARKPGAIRRPDARGPDGRVREEDAPPPKDPRAPGRRGETRASLGWIRGPVRQDGVALWRRAQEERLESTVKQMRGPERSKEGGSTEVRARPMPAPPAVSRQPDRGQKAKQPPARVKRQEQRPKEGSESGQKAPQKNVERARPPAPEQKGDESKPPRQQHGRGR